MSKCNLSKSDEHQPVGSWADPINKNLGSDSENASSMMTLIIADTKENNMNKMSSKFLMLKEHS